MIIDANAYLGFFAFRQIRHNKADALLKLMDEKGIDRAMVSSASAITYRNVQPANEELAAAVERHCIESVSGRPGVSWSAIFRKLSV